MHSPRLALFELVRAFVFVLRGLDLVHADVRLVQVVAFVVGSR
jgi:hypothetical protein